MESPKRHQRALADHANSFPEKNPETFKQIVTAITELANTKALVSQKNVAEQTGIDLQDVRAAWPMLLHKTTRIAVRLSVIDKALLEAKAKNQNISMSELLAGSIANTPSPKWNQKDLPELNALLQIKNELKSIANKISDTPNPERLDTLAELVSIERQVEALFNSAGGKGQ